MLLSPAQCHQRLSKIISVDNGPHTALLATPTGQLVSQASREPIDKSEDDTEPWLDEPERTRLLLGLLSQWEEHESPRIECELGRLFVKSIRLAPADSASHPSLPAVRSPVVSKFILLVNGSSTARWQDLEQTVGWGEGLD